MTKHPHIHKQIRYKNNLVPIFELRTIV